MSLLTPEVVPVKIYRWDDVGAPALDKSAGCMMNIFKACLVTGYGTKEPADWTMPFEDIAGGVKVFQPKSVVSNDFYLRCLADNGSMMTAEVLLNMTDANTGDLKLKMPDPFKFGYKTVTGKWVMFVSDLGLCFFSESKYEGDENRSGAYFMVGNTVSSSTGKQAVFLQHRGGQQTYGDYTGIFSAYGSRYQAPQFLLDDVVTTGAWRSIFNGYSETTTATHFSDIYIIIGGEIYVLPGILAPSNSAVHQNYDTNRPVDGFGDVMMVGSSGKANEFLGVLLEEWRY